MVNTPMVNMAKTPDDVKKEIGSMGAVPCSPATSTYPYGLSISFDDETLKKLGLSGDIPQIGEVVQFCASAKVTSASLNENEKADGTKEQCCRIELQITDMAMMGGDPADDEVAKSEARRKRFYGGGEPDGDEG